MSSQTQIPLLYRLFFLYIEPISALIGALYAVVLPSQYLNLLTLSSASRTISTIETPVYMTLSQLGNLYTLFALNEHLVLSSTTSIRTWKTLLFCLLIADLGHLATMMPLGGDVFWKFWEWNAMVWGSVGFVYAGATMRCCFLSGIGLSNSRSKDLCVVDSSQYP